MEVDFLEAGKLLDTTLYEKLLSGLADEQPDGVYSTGEVIGTEMNELKVPSSPIVVKALRKIYFGDSTDADNSEVLWRYVERPAQMFIVTGNVNQMMAKLPDLFEKQGTLPFDGRTLDLSKLETANEPDNEKKLIASLEAQK
mmetsp:Transcript_10654/g.18918  ORF Transcript_10654/g.18918 Transcript_10654/m.18918 type:complete len:142 (-) Transcript_10654:368-793(-)